ncbi:MAG: lectin like domain-containing protein [Actinomycetaceae bacterium]|nr:lectin like domain-containing protein [Actinomycetaceae bacterium]
MTRRFFKRAALVPLVALALALPTTTPASAENEPLAGDVMTRARTDAQFSATPPEQPDSPHEAGWRADPLIIDTAEQVSGHERLRSAPLPARFDLRQTGRISPIRDQGPNGSCWAFAALGALESNLRPNEVRDFSEAHMRNTHGFDWGPNDGGSRLLATAYLARQSGPVDEKDDPYHPYRFTSPANLKRQKDLTHALFLPDQRSGTDTRTLKEAVRTYGAVSTTITGNESFMNWRTAGHYNPGYGYADHAVDIVGWDDNYSVANFSTRPPGPGAWIVRNSWGRGWGDRGYYYVSYYDAYIGKNNSVFLTTNVDPNRQLYQYDPLGATSSIGNGRDAWFANVFTASNKKQGVNGVGFWAMAAGLNYEVYVATNVRGSSDLTRRQKVAEGRLTFAGYHTINFDPVAVAPGSSFATIVHVSGSGYNYLVPIEAPLRGFSSRANASAGQSFISAGGQRWDDLTRSQRGSNVALKAMTTTNLNGKPAPNEPTPIPTPEPTPAPDPTPEPKPQPQPGTDALNVWLSARTLPGASVYGYTPVTIDVSVVHEFNRGVPVAQAPVYFTLTKPDGSVIKARGMTDRYGRLKFYSPGEMQNLRGTYRVHLITQSERIRPAQVRFYFTVV